MSNLTEFWDQENFVNEMLFFFFLKMQSKLANTQEWCGFGLFWEVLAWGGKRYSQIANQSWHWMASWGVDALCLLYAWENKNKQKQQGVYACEVGKHDDVYVTQSEMIVTFSNTRLSHRWCKLMSTMQNCLMGCVMRKAWWCTCDVEWNEGIVTFSSTG